ncbi:MAG: alpha-glucan family phosphorylase [Gemmatimonadetes bacterium]|nr:alpha-glucan family phosphorylase [Gemmatimonadota bacterium]
MEPIGTFRVSPRLPPALERLRELAYNLRWAWDHSSLELFRRLDADLWEDAGHNPVLLLGRIDQSRLEAAAEDEAFLSHLDGVSRFLDDYLTLTKESTWFRRAHGSAPAPLIAYFSAEFGLTECLSIFAGGLGILAGDHLKSASDLGLPLVGVGLLYQQGYFRQVLNDAGRQQEIYQDNDFYTLPLALERRPDGNPLTIAIAFPGRQVAAQVWRARVGRIPLYLLDTNIPANGPGDRDITDQLYGGDLEMRIQQEILLGIGGCRVLEALGLDPVVCHMNEGHSAFLALERIRRLMERHGLDFAEARELASAGLVFTTHTPVAAGHDAFPHALMARYFEDYARGLGISLRELLVLGRQDAENDGEPFGMTVLALRLAAHSNGVSRLHGRVSRPMWRGLWPGVPEHEIPIGTVTNGVHFRSWISLEMDQLYDRYLGPRWREEPADETAWGRAGRIPSEELWRTHERRRERLVAFARRRLRTQFARRGASRAELEEVEEVLDVKALTIGFARRFAAYKRATLLFRDPDRLARILGDADRPVQILIAGKAHPRDEVGKDLIRQIVSLAREPPFHRRLAFLEDYDMAAARYLVQGSDVWLNTPRRPLEASGTSGMKAAANGVLNLSTLDGWWAEAWDVVGGEALAGGWAIGGGELYSDPEEQDRVEAEALYALLERTVVPAFYDRDAGGLPRRWVGGMKAALGRLCPIFNTHRMVREYTDRFYMPAASRARRLAADEAVGARALAAWKTRVLAGWSAVSVEAVDAGPADEVEVGEQVCVRARVRLGSLGPEDVAVQLYIGRLDPRGMISEATAIRMQPGGPVGDTAHVFEASAVPCPASGLHGYTIRVLPQHADLDGRFLPGLIAWAGPETAVE